MQSLRQRLVDVNDWNAASIQEAIQQTVDEADVGFGKVGQPLRLAITGVTASPAMNEVMAMLSRDDVLARIDQMIAQASVD